MNELGLVQVLLGNFLSLPPLDLVLRLTLCEVPGLLVHLKTTDSFTSHGQISPYRHLMRTLLMSVPGAISCPAHVYLLSIFHLLLPHFVQVSTLVHIVQVEICFSLCLRHLCPQSLLQDGLLVGKPLTQVSPLEPVQVLHPHPHPHPRVKHVRQQEGSQGVNVPLCTRGQQRTAGASSSPWGCCAVMLPLAWPHVYP